MQISNPKTLKVGMIILIALVFPFFAISESKAGPFTPDTYCESKGGSWSGSSGAFATGTCTFEPGTYPDTPLCPVDYTTLVLFDGGANGLHDCVAPPTSLASPGPAARGKCKLLDIDNSLQVGHIFSAAWIGNLESIRFRQSSGATTFIQSVSGTEHFENGHRAGSFLASGLDRGRWEASCWGAEGTFGATKIVFIK